MYFLCCLVNKICEKPPSSSVILVCVLGEQKFKINPLKLGNIYKNQNDPL